MHDCPYCECEPVIPRAPRDLEKDPLTPFEETMRAVYGPLLVANLADDVRFSRIEKGE